MANPTFAGTSGARYSFANKDQVWLLPRTAGNYLYARQQADAWTILFVGDCDDLVEEAERRWPEAVSQHGATHLFVRRNVSSRARFLEQRDLVRRFDPVMNDDASSAAPEHMQPTPDAWQERDRLYA